MNDVIRNSAVSLKSHTRDEWVVVQVSNVFRAIDDESKFLIFISGNALLVDVDGASEATIRINNILVEVATIYFNEAVHIIHPPRADIARESGREHMLC